MTHKIINQSKFFIKLNSAIRSIFTCIILTSLGSIFTITQAFAFGVDKILVEIKPGPLRREAMLRIFNDNDRTTHYAAKVYDWSISPDGREVLTPVIGLTVKPPVLRVPAKQNAEFTFKYSGLMSLKKEKTYRVVVQEFVGVIPDISDADADAAPLTTSSLSISSQMSIPIYALPDSNVEPFDGAKLNYYQKPDGQIMVKVENNGDKRYMLLALTVDGVREEYGTYVLAGTTIELPLRKKDADKTKNNKPTKVEAILRFIKDEKIIPVPGL